MTARFEMDNKELDANLVGTGHLDLENRPRPIVDDRLLMRMCGD